MMSYLIEPLGCGYHQEVVSVASGFIVNTRVLKKASSDNVHFVQIHFLGTRAVTKFEYTKVVL